MSTRINPPLRTSPALRNLRRKVCRAEFWGPLGLGEAPGSGQSKDNRVMNYHILGTFSRGSAFPRILALGAKIRSANLPTQSAQSRGGAQRGVYDFMRVVD